MNEKYIESGNAIKRTVDVRKKVNSRKVDKSYQTAHEMKSLNDESED